MEAENKPKSTKPANTAPTNCATKYSGSFLGHMRPANTIATETAEVTAVGDGIEAPDFTLNDINGKPLTLSSLRGKHVILDFWGSWCGWCIKGIPQMKEYYQKYAGKFEILGIDCNDPEEKWKAAVDEHQLPWLQVRCPDESMEMLASKYNIEGFPTKVVIDPEGKLVKVVVGEDPAFYTFLDELFAK